MNSRSCSPYAFFTLPLCSSDSKINSIQCPCSPPNKLLLSPFSITFPEVLVRRSVPALSLLSGQTSVKIAVLWDVQVRAAEGNTLEGSRDLSSSAVPSC